MFTNLVVVRCIVVIKVIKHTSRLVLCHLINMSQNVRAIESEAELHAFVFKHEFTMVVAGPSRSGKTEFVKALVRHKDRVIHPPPTKVVWCYREWQKAYEDMGDVKFVKEIPQDDEVLVSDTSEQHLLVFDDMMGSGDAIVVAIGLLAKPITATPAWYTLLRTYSIAVRIIVPSAWTLITWCYSKTPGTNPRLTSYRDSWNYRAWITPIKMPRDDRTDTWW